MSAVKEVAEVKAVNEMRAAFGIPVEVGITELWSVVRGEAREICARAEPAPGERQPFAKFLEGVRKGWQRPEPPPNHGEAAFLAALCGKAGIHSRLTDQQSEQIGRFIYAFLRMLCFSGPFPKLTRMNLDSLTFSMHLDMLSKKPGALVASR